MLCHRCGKILHEGALVCPDCGLGIPCRVAAQQVARNTAPSPREEVHDAASGYAGFWRRAAALVVDRTLLAVVNLTLSTAFLLVAGRDREWGDPRVVFLASAIFGFLLHWLYFTLMESSVTRATLGKAAIGIAVTDRDGRRISLLRANGRYWAKLISTIPLCFGYLMAGFTPRKQALHDMIAGTLVVRKPRPLPPGDAGEN